MGIQPSEALKMPLADYQGVLWTWNDDAEPESEKAHAPAPIEFNDKAARWLEEMGQAKVIH